jgi:hypothetical protein
MSNTEISVAAQVFYSIYERGLTVKETRNAVFVNPVRPAEDYREPHETSVAGCEGGQCAIGAVEDAP